MGLCFSSSPPDEDEPENHPHFAGGNVTLVTTKDAWDRKLSEAKTQGKIVIANFSASWCGPCKSLAPYYIELSETHPSLMFLTVDVDEMTDSDRNLHKIAINNVNKQDNLYRGIRMLISPTSKESASSFSKFILLPPSLWKQSPPFSNSGRFDFEVKEFSTHWEVKATPTFFFLRDGQQFDKLVGANKSELQKKITTIVDSQVPAGQK